MELKTKKYHYLHQETNNLQPSVSKIIQKIVEGRQPGENKVRKPGK